MPSTGHAHRMEPIAWTTRGSIHAEDEGYQPLLHAPAVLFGCTRGVCSKTEVVRPTKRSRKVPDFMPVEHFDALKSGAYWNEITGV